jgi:hypothetical protein
MESAGSHRRYQLKRRPRKYPRLPQQQKFIKALEFCGIKKGISKREMMEKMVHCIPRFFKEHKDDDKGVHSEAL